MEEKPVTYQLKQVLTKEEQQLLLELLHNPDQQGNISRPQIDCQAPGQISQEDLKKILGYLIQRQALSSGQPAEGGKSDSDFDRTAELISKLQHLYAPDMMAGRAKKKTGHLHRPKAERPKSNHPLYDENGFLKKVTTAEEAKKVIRHYSPEITREQSHVFLRSPKEFFVHLLCVVGGFMVIAVLIVKISGKEFPNIIVLPILAGAVLFLVLFDCFRTWKARKKNRSIMSGEYFTGKSDEELIEDANRHFVLYQNRGVIFDKAIREKHK